MEGYCSCGAKLAEDSLFCHRCGRPLRADLIEAENARVEVPEEPEVVEALPADTFVPSGAGPVTFQNKAAVRSGLVAAAQAVLLSFPLTVIVGPLAQLLLNVASGAYSTFLYRRRTKEGLEPVGALRLGWMTGVFSFVIVTVIVTFSFVVIANNADVMRELKRNDGPVKVPPEVLKNFESIQQHPEALLLELFGQFMVTTLLGALGGWLGGRLRSASPPPRQER